MWASFLTLSPRRSGGAGLSKVKGVMQRPGSQGSRGSLCATPLLRSPPFPHLRRAPPCCCPLLPRMVPPSVDGTSTVVLRK